MCYLRHIRIRFLAAAIAAACIMFSASAGMAEAAAKRHVNNADADLGVDSFSYTPKEAGDVLIVGGTYTATLTYSYELKTSFQELYIDVIVVFTKTGGGSSRQLIDEAIYTGPQAAGSTGTNS